MQRHRRDQRELERARQDLQESILRLAQQIGAQEHDLVSFHGADRAIPFVGIKPDGTYVWEIAERGETLDLRTTIERDDLLYWSLKHITWAVATRWVKANPTGDQEYRVQVWTRQIQLLHSLAPAWSRRWHDEQTLYFQERQPETVSLLPSIPSN